MTAAPSYFPRPGTVAYRALTLLEAQPEGRKLTAGAMAGELGVSAASVLSSIEQSLACGLIVRSTPRGQERPGMFHVDRAEVARARASLQIVVAEELPQPDAAVAAADPDAVEEVAPEKRVESALLLVDYSPPRAAGGLVFGLWSDGTLEIARRSASGDDLIAALSPDETRALVDYMDTMSLDWLRGGS